jgi:hypothetical protein
MNTPQMIGALAALVLAVAALIRTLGGAFETRFSDLKRELAQVRAELESERRLRIVAETRSREAEMRATQAEHHVNQLVHANAELRREVELMRYALVGTEAERNEALKELARQSDDRERERTAGAAEKTAPHKAAK